MKQVQEALPYEEAADAKEKAKGFDTDRAMMACGEAIYGISQDSEYLAVVMALNTWAVVTLEEHKEFNLAWVGEAEDKDGTLDNVEAVVLFLNEYHQPATLMLPEGNKEMIARAVAAGAVYEPEENTPLMYLNGDSLVESEEKNDVIIERITELRDIEDVRRIQAEVFEFDQNTLNRTFDKDVLNSDDVEIYIAKSGNKVVSTVTVVRHNNTISIWNMGTDPEEGRKGYGRTLLQNVIKQYKAHGNTNFVLLATEEGEGLYTKMGFKTLSTLEICVINPKK